MKRLFLLQLFLPTLLAAEPITIRSGEHETFSRLVFSIGIGTEWKVEKTGEGFVLNVGGQEDGFDTTQVFDRIPRDRLESVTQVSPEALLLSVGCACDVDAFLWKPGELVVDVINPSQDLADVTGPQVPIQDQTLSPEVALTQEAVSLLPDLLANSEPQQSLPFAPQKAVLNADLSETEIALAEGIARAATQGFLTPAFTEPVVMEPAVSLALDAFEMAPDDESIPPILMGRPGVGISTAMDRDLIRLGNELGRSLDQQCASPELFQVAMWGDDRSFHEQVAALADSLAGEFGEEPREAQENLVRLYIYFGFGAEANAVLSAESTSSQSRLILSELASVVDGDEGRFPVLKTQFDCTSAGRMWAFLIAPAVLEDAERNHVIQQFFDLPQPLRGQISPRMARRFIEIGDPEAASRILQATENNDASALHDVHAARALMAEEFDDNEGAKTMLSNQVDDNARTTPQSLIRLIELQIEQGEKPSEANLLLASALQLEHRDTAMAQNLSDAEAKGRIVNDQYLAALNLVIGREDASAMQIIDQIYSRITEQADTETFLEFVYIDIPKGLTPISENAIARRLIDLGFPERAGMFLSGPAEREAASQRRYLRAEVALSRSEYERALDALLGMTDERSRSLRAAAYEGMGDYDAALSALTPDQASSSLELLFRASAWERLTLDEDEVLSTFAQAARGFSSETQIETLADRQAILTQSQESRLAVENLLRRFDGTTVQD